VGAANPERKALLDRLEAGELPADVSVAEFEPARTCPRAPRRVRSSTRSPRSSRALGRFRRPRRVEPHDDQGRQVVHPAEWSTHEWSGDPYGRVLHFGIREHAMGAIVNGIKLHGPTRPFGGTFLIFSDYMRPPVRLAALMDIPSIFVWTHDSVALGEDGPTHQPIEQLSTLRLIPNFTVVRPADANETSAAWLEIVRRTSGGPVGIALTRQNIPVFPRGEAGFATTDGVAKGAYVLIDAEGGAPT
jgi:transketolase